MAIYRDAKAIAKDRAAVAIQKQQQDRKNWEDQMMAINRMMDSECTVVYSDEWRNRNNKRKVNRSM